MATHLHHRDNNTHGLSPPIQEEEGLNFIIRRKIPLEIQTLEVLYSDDKNPTQSRVKDYATALGLTYEQVRKWYIERRRKDKQNAGHMEKGNEPAGNTTKAKSNSKNNKRLLMIEPAEGKRYIRPGLVQDTLYPPDYIFKKIFRKDGPPLGSEFDSLPSTAFQGRCSTDNRSYNTPEQGEQRAPKRRKVSEAAEKQSQPKAPIKHGKGKGLMSDWQMTSNANSRASRGRKGLSGKKQPPAKKHGVGKGLMIVRQHADPDCNNTRDRISKRRKPVRRAVKKVQEKSKPAGHLRRVEPSCNKNQKAYREICKLALDIGSYGARSSSYPELTDDEELELRELQAGPNALTCSAHFDTGGRHGCSLCKGLLPKFPPDFVKMRKPLPMHPWGSNLKLEKKLFKAFYFLYTYAVTLDLCPFSLGEFAKSFIEKESLLLGKLHVYLLRHLFSDVYTELSSDISIHSNTNGMFLNLLHMAESQKSLVDFWKTYLNPLTWTEILRQVMIAAGFGSKDGIQKNRCIQRGGEPMMKYGLRPGTLKGALFDILFKIGNKGMKITELAKSSQVVDFNLGKSDGELEDSICSILAGDITLFEKISVSTYRIRLSSLIEKDEDGQSDAEGCGSIDDGYREGSFSSINRSEWDSGNSTSLLDKELQVAVDNNRLNTGTEIDESHQGELWLLGLMEGEHSDLGIEEKLNALLALIDLLSAGSSIRIKDSSTLLKESVPSIDLHGSGGKIKRSTLRHPNSSTTCWGDTSGARKGYQLPEVCPVDSSVAFSMSHDDEMCSSRRGAGNHLHPMQSIYLGSDRRYNRYWLFLGPCDADDPGHARIYLESSEDGQWQVIESEQALCGIVGTLNNKGRREDVLLKSLEKRMPFLLREMSKQVIMEAAISLSTHSDISELDMVNEECSPSPVSDIVNNFSLSESSPHAVNSTDAVVVEVSKVELQKQTYDGLQQYDSWVWSCFYSVLHAVKCGKQSYSESLTRCASCHDLYWRDERHCKTCHTTFELDFDLEEKYAVHVAMCQRSKDDDICPMHKVLPSQLQALKAAAHAIELVIPEDALVGAWQKSAHKLWVRRLRRTFSLHELLQPMGEYLCQRVLNQCHEHNPSVKLADVLADFVGAINLEWLSQHNDCDSFVSSVENVVSCFKNMPRTLSAVAFWLVKLDTLIAPHLDEVVEVVSL